MPQEMGKLPSSLHMEEATLVIKVGYRGGAFAGFAEQPAQRTVAGELRRALETVLRRSVELTCAGRTDAGVHALAQYVSLPVYGEELARSSQRLTSSLVALTPDDISIKGLYKAPRGFSARFDALERSYRYRISCGASRPVMAWDHAWWLKSCGHLDSVAMDTASKSLLGEHDFSSFCKASSAQLIQEDGRSLSRNVGLISVGEICEAGEPLVVVDISANAFLHNMVRVIVGSLVEVGRGHRDKSWIKMALEARDRRTAGPTAPAKGLTFVDVSYPEGSLAPWE